MNEVFLGGTCGNNRWREDLVIPALRNHGVPEDTIFNPNLGPGQWNEEAQELEDRVKRSCALMVYYIGDPKDGTGISPYSVVEATMALYDDLDRSFVVIDSAGVEDHAKKALNKIWLDWRRRFSNARIEQSLDELIRCIVERYGRRK
jgi:hypothetical protein